MTVRHALAVAALVAATAGSGGGCESADRPEDRTTHGRPRAGAACVALRVTDGDTLRVSCDALGEIRVRLVGIDAPEVRPRECFGREATERVRELVPPAALVRLVADETQGGLDRYGRTLAYVTLPDGRDLGLELIRGGFAREYTYRKPHRRTAAYRLEERRASARRLGLWGACA